MCPTRRTTLKAALVTHSRHCSSSRSGRVRRSPQRHPYRRGAPRLRGLHLSRALHVRRTLGLRRHAPERRHPRAHRRRQGGLGLRVDAARQCLVVPERAVRCLARRDAGAGRRSAPHRRRLRRSMGIRSIWPVRSIPQFLRAADAVSRTAVAAGVDSAACARWSSSSPFDAALHDAYGKVFGVSAYATYTREFMNGDLVARPRRRSSRASTSIATCRQGRRPTMPVFHSVGASDPIEPSDVKQRVERWPAEHAGGVDPARWPDSLQDQAERRQPARRSSIASIRIDRVVSRVLPSRGVQRLEVSARLQRGLPERCAICSSSCARSARRRPAGSAASSTSSSRRHGISKRIAPT